MNDTSEIIEAEKSDNECKIYDELNDYKSIFYDDELNAYKSYIIRYSMILSWLIEFQK